MSQSFKSISLFLIQPKSSNLYFKQITAEYFIFHDSIPCPVKIGPFNSFLFSKQFTLRSTGILRQQCQKQWRYGSLINRLASWIEARHVGRHKPRTTCIHNDVLSRVFVELSLLYSRECSHANLLGQKRINRFS